MIISHQLKFIFIHVHRTGGSALSNILRPKINSSFEISAQHANARSLEPSFFEKYKDYFTFGFARNPWERILSWYSLIHFNDQRKLSEERIRLEEFIKKDYAIDPSNQYFHYNTLDYFTDSNGKIIADRIFQFENFENEAKHLFNNIKIQAKDIPKLNDTSLKRYRMYYTDRSQYLIAEKCMKDIDYFNYKF